MPYAPRYLTPDDLASGNTSVITGKLPVTSRHTPVSKLPYSVSSGLGMMQDTPPPTSQLGREQQQAGGIFGRSATPQTQQMPMVQPGVSGDAQMAQKRPGFFQHGGLGGKLLRFLGDVAINYSASNGDPAAMATIQNRMYWQRQRAEAAERQRVRDEDRSWQVEDRDYTANRPVIRNVGNELTRYDPTTGQTSLLYQGLSPEEEYVKALGLDPNTDEGQTAMQDYILRGNGPTAFGYDSRLEGIRQGNRIGIEGVRQSNRMSLRGSPTYRDAHPRTTAPKATTPPRSPSAVVAPLLEKQAKGGTLSPSEQAVVDQYYRGRRAGGLFGSGGSSTPASARPAAAPPTAVDAHGNKVVWNGKAWVPSK